MATKAMQRTHQVPATMPAINAFAISIKGDRKDREEAAEFWQRVVEEDVLEKIGIQTQVEHNAEQSIVMWSPHASQQAAPICTLKTFLAIASARTLLNAECQPGPILARIKWQGRLLWQANVREDTDTKIIRDALQRAAAVDQGEREIRLICNGRPQCADTSISEWAQIKTEQGQREATIHVVHAKHGGGSLDTSKQSKATATKNAIATTLLQQGYNLHDTAKAVEDIVKKTSINKLAAIMQGNHQHKQQAIKELCREAAIELPEVSPLTQARLESGAGRQKKQRLEIDPSTLRLPEDYFTNEDGAKARQLVEFRPHGTGIFITTAQIATQLLQGDKCLSKDELAIIVIGQEGIQTKLQAETIQLPATDAQGKETLLAATMIQAGEKKIRHIFHEQTHTTQEKILIVAWTIWRDTFGEEEWAQISKAPEAALREQQKREGHGDHIRAIWGRSSRKGKMQAPPNEATSIQLHSSVPWAAAEKILEESGWNRWFATPKDISGNPATDWKIIWTTDTQDGLLGKSAALPSCSGLARNMKGLGIRVKTDQFKEAWDILHPNKQAPTTLAQHHTYKITPLPYGTTNEAVEKWGQSYNWHVKALKTLGARTWLIASETPKPEGTMGYNGQPVLVQELIGRHKEQGPVIAGARPRPRTYQGAVPGQGPGAQAKDPWSAYIDQHGTTGIGQQANPVAQPRKLEGPTEARFQTQDKRMEKLEQELQALRTDQTTLGAQVKAEFEQAANREQAFQSAVKQDLLQLNSSFTRQMQEHQTEFRDTLNDLKSFFIQQSKQSHPGKKRSGEHTHDMEQDG